LPSLVEQGSALGRSLGSLHETLTWILLGLVAVHVGAALVHLFVYKDRVIYRMLTG
jgi:cytochrome b561